jgi:hypothetical protein
VQLIPTRYRHLLYVSLASIHLPNVSKDIVLLPYVIRTIVLSVDMVYYGSSFIYMRLRYDYCKRMHRLRLCVAVDTSLGERIVACMSSSHLLQ